MLSRIKFSVLAASLALGLVFANGAIAVSLSAGDCSEGGDFIRNAALSRDNGIKAEQFINTLEDDLSRVRDMPAASRWFAYSDIEAQMLRKATYGVFMKPKDADRHRAEFIQFCESVRNSVAYRENKRATTANAGL